MNSETFMVLVLVCVVASVMGWIEGKRAKRRRRESVLRGVADYSGEKIEIKDGVVTIRAAAAHDVMEAAVKEMLMADVVDAWEEAFRETEGIYSGCELAAGALIYLRCAVNRRMRERSGNEVTEETKGTKVQ